MKFTIIACMDVNRVIGYNNTIPWHVPSDLKRFKALTTNKTVVMGRKTYESIGKPLPNRTNIVVTSSSLMKNQESLHFVSSFEKAIELAKSLETKTNNECFIIGGASLYETALKDVVDTIYLTMLDFESSNGDVFFPVFNKEDWTCVCSEPYIDEKSTIHYVFLILQRKGSNVEETTIVKT